MCAVFWSVKVMTGNMW